MIKPHTEIFASSPADEQSVEKAKQYIEKHGLTSDDVKLVRGENSIIVIAKREFELKLPPQEELYE